MIEYLHGLVSRVGDNGGEPRQDGNIIILSAMLASPGLDIGVIGLLVIECCLAREDHVGVARAEFA
jgi:hypothetical protein